VWKFFPLSLELQEEFHLPNQIIYSKVKCTLVQALRLCTGRTAHRESRGIAYPFLITAQEGGEGSASRLGRSLPPEKTRYPLYRRPGGPQGRSRQVRKISPPPGFDPASSNPQPVAIPTTLSGTQNSGISCVYFVRINSEYYPKQHYPIGLCSGKAMCFRWDMSLYFKRYFHSL
jgi:hypothetical protein